MLTVNDAHIVIVSVRGQPTGAEGPLWTDVRRGLDQRRPGASRRAWPASRHTAEQWAHRNGMPLVPVALVRRADRGRGLRRLGPRRTGEAPPVGHNHPRTNHPQTATSAVDRRATTVTRQRRQSRGIQWSVCAHTPSRRDPLLNILTRHGPRTVTGAVRGPQAERLEVRRSEFEKRAGCGERRRVIENAGASGEEVLHRVPTMINPPTTHKPSSRSDAGYPGRRASREMLMTPQGVVALTAWSDRNR